MRFLISSWYRGKGKSTLWMLNTENGDLKKVREEIYYPVGKYKKDYIFFGMDLHDNKLYTAGCGVLSVFDKRFNLLDRREFEILDQTHDLSVINGKIYCTNTGYDRIEIFDSKLIHKKTIELKKLPYFKKKRLFQKNPLTKQSLHPNFISYNEKDNRIFFTHSFIVERNIKRTFMVIFRAIRRRFGWIQKRNAGFILSKRKFKTIGGGGVFELQGKKIITGIYGAHDGVFYKGKFYLNETHNIRTLIYSDKFDLLKTIEYDRGFILRGLYPISGDKILVGSTPIDPSRTGSRIYRNIMTARKTQKYAKKSDIRIIDVYSGNPLKVINVPSFEGVSPEIFKIIKYPFDSRS